MRCSTSILYILLILVFQICNAVTLPGGLSDINLIPVPKCGLKFLLPPDNMNAGHYSHTETLLSNGKILVVGGGSAPELFDPITRKWEASSLTTTFPQPNRTGHTATLLPNGKVLIVGGAVGSDGVQLYDPVTATWRGVVPTSAGLQATMPTPRNRHTATLMPNGKVLVAGGFSVTTQNTTDNVAIFDPQTESWSSWPYRLDRSRADHTATLLPDGKVLITGGVSTTFPDPRTNNPVLERIASVEVFSLDLGKPSPRALTLPRAKHKAVWVATGGPLGTVLIIGGQSNTPQPTVEVYDPATSTWLTPIPSPANWMGHTVTQLPNGRVLIVSHNIAQELDPVTRIWQSPKQTLVDRYNHTATLLESGIVLLAGTSSDPTLATSTEFVQGRALPDPGHDWKPGPPMRVARYGHTSTLLPDGKVLVTGGIAGATILNSAEIYDPVTQQWNPIANMPIARRGHTATLLPNGKVLLAGGVGVSGNLATAVLFDLVTRSWSSTGVMGVARSEHTATLLPNGKVLVAGGWMDGSSRRAEIFDSSSGSWASAGEMGNTRIGHAANLLPDGRVLVTGGAAPSYFGALEPQFGAEVYDLNTGFNPSTGITGTWSRIFGPATSRFYHSATLSRSNGPLGSLILIGGASSSSGTATNSTERLNNHFANGTLWTTEANMFNARSSHSETLLPDGGILVAAGRFGSGALATAEIFDPFTSSWLRTGSLDSARQAHRATRLVNGQVLVSGGRDANQTPLASTEIYTACAP